MPVQMREILKDWLNRISQFFQKPSDATSESQPVASDPATTPRVSQDELISEGEMVTAIENLVGLSSAERKKYDTRALLAINGKPQFRERLQNEEILRLRNQYPKGGHREDEDYMASKTGFRTISPSEYLCWLNQTWATVISQLDFGEITETTTTISLGTRQFALPSFL